VLGFADAARRVSCRMSPDPGSASSLIKTTPNDPLLTLARDAQKKRLETLADYTDSLSTPGTKELSRRLRRVADCKGISWSSDYRCESNHLCLPCAVADETELASKRLQGYAELDRLKQDRAFFVSLTARPAPARPESPVRGLLRYTYPYLHRWR